MNPSTALARVLVDALIRLGVRHAVLCPGSRSSALAYALADADRFPVDADLPAGPTPGDAPSNGNRLQVHVRVDERAAGFLALGLAKETDPVLGTRVPAVVVTTSGTAVANLHPAVLEASHAGVPMLVLSADRPHELRGTGANQTTDQVKLFGDAVRLFAEIPAPDTRAGQARSWRNVMSRAVAAAVGVPGAHPGPVQVNVAFREPLVPDEGDGGDGVNGRGDGSVSWPEPLTGTAGLTRVQVPVTSAPVRLPDGPRTVVLAGDGSGPVAAEVAADGGWPLLAEPSSGARFGLLAVGPYRLLLDHPELGGAVERVVVFGRPTLSRPVSRLLAREDVEVIVVSPRPDWTDAAARAVLVVPAVRSSRTGARTGARTGGWLERWLVAGLAARKAVDTVLEAGLELELEQELGLGLRFGGLNGPLLAREVAAALEPGQALVAGSSNAIRDLDLAAHPFPDPPTPPDARVVLANRGLAGIDGTLSTACGAALARSADGRPTPVRALVGDLTFLHDATGLASGPFERRPQVQVVLLDDGGGGIFGLLEPGVRATRSAPDAAVFERVFATPTGTDLPSLCTAVGATYAPIAELGELREALAKPEDGVSVLHIRADRSARAALADAIADAARGAVQAAIAP